MARFKIGDLVRIVGEGSKYYGLTGRITGVRHPPRYEPVNQQEFFETIACDVVNLDDGPIELSSARDLEEEVRLT